MRIRSFSQPTRNSGFSLVELMVALVVGVLVSLTAVVAFMSHSRAMFNQLSYNHAAEEVSEAYALLSRLIQQAERDSITISGVKSEGNCTTDIQVDLAVPAGFPVWPNLASPYDKNWVRLSMSTTGDNAHSILVSNAAEGGLGDATAMPFAGSNQGNNTRITCMSLVKQNDDTFAFSLTGYARAFNEGDVSFEGVVLPRN